MADRVSKEYHSRYSEWEYTIAMTDYYTGFEVSKHSSLGRCSRCGTKRIARVDPWIVLKACPHCGHVDPVPSAVIPSSSVPSSVLERTPETITLAEVQRLLVGVLRQVDGNKVVVHPAEFDINGVSLIQETNTETGTVTIWFEKQSDEICGDIFQTDHGVWRCTFSKGHRGPFHGDASGKYSTTWAVE